MVRITLRQRRNWLLVAGHTAQIIKNIVDNFNEQQITNQLNELEKLAEEATSRKKNQKPLKLNQALEVMKKEKKQSSKS